MFGAEFTDEFVNELAMAGKKSIATGNAFSALSVDSINVNEPVFSRDALSVWDDPLAFTSVFPDFFRMSDETVYIVGSGTASRKNSVATRKLVGETLTRLQSIVLPSDSDITGKFVFSRSSDTYMVLASTGYTYVFKLSGTSWVLVGTISANYGASKKVFVTIFQGACYIVVSTMNKDSVPQTSTIYAYVLGTDDSIGPLIDWSFNIGGKAPKFITSADGTKLYCIATCLNVGGKYLVANVMNASGVWAHCTITNGPSYQNAKFHVVRYGGTICIGLWYADYTPYYQGLKIMEATDTVITGDAAAYNGGGNANAATNNYDDYCYLSVNMVGTDCWEAIYSNPYIHVYRNFDGGYSEDSYSSPISGSAQQSGCFYAYNGYVYFVYAEFAPNSTPGALKLLKMTLTSAGIIDNVTPWPITFGSIPASSSDSGSSRAYHIAAVVFESKLHVFTTSGNPPYWVHSIVDFSTGITQPATGVTAPQNGNYLMYPAVINGYLYLFVAGSYSGLTTYKFVAGAWTYIGCNSLIPYISGGFAQVGNDVFAIGFETSGPSLRIAKFVGEAWTLTQASGSVVSGQYMGVYCFGGEIYITTNSGGASNTFYLYRITRSTGVVALIATSTATVTNLTGYVTMFSDGTNLFVLFSYASSAGEMYFSTYKVDFSAGAFVFIGTQQILATGAGTYGIRQPLYGTIGEIWMQNGSHFEKCVWQGKYWSYPMTVESNGSFGGSSYRDANVPQCLVPFNGNVYMLASYVAGSYIFKLVKTAVSYKHLSNAKMPDGLLCLSKSAAKVGGCVPVAPIVIK